MTERHELRIHSSVAEFIAEVEPWLMRKEDLNSQIISIARVLTTQDHPFREPIYLASLQENGAVVGCALAANPDGLELTEMPESRAVLFVPSAAERRPGLPWVGGPPEAALAFARAWAARHGSTWQIRHDFVEFRLDEIVEPRSAPGRLRLAEAADWPTLSEWAPDYAAATNAPVDVAGFLERRLRRRELYIWDHEGPKTLVAISGNTPNSARVSAVYTPPPYRCRGYASNGVAAASRRALEKGATFCVLFAERQPAQLSRIYRGIGYRPIRDHLMIELAR
jgi:uncharacterized protein